MLKIALIDDEKIVLRGIAALMKKSLVLNWWELQKMELMDCR